MSRAENRELRGWLLDVYPDREEGVIVWIIGDDGHRYRLTQDFSATFCVRGDEKAINAVYAYLEKQKLDVTAQRIRRKELFEGLIDVLAICVRTAALHPRVFKQLHNAFPRLEYFDAEISLPIRYHTAHHIFPLAFCRITTNERKQIQYIEALDSKWDLAPTMPSLRILSI